MDARIYITLLVFTKLNWIYSITISGSVSDDVEFIYETFPVKSSMRASIEVDVYYPHNSSTPYPILGIYTTRDHMNVKVKCAFKRYGQLGNYNLHPGITMDSYESEPLNCHVDNTINRTHCTGNITVQDFKPRHFSFSFGFQCFNCFSCSLRGLSYNLKIYGQTNETHCLAMSHRTANTCYTYSQYGVFPNLLGHMNIDIDPRDLKFECLDHVIPFICYVYLPKCDPVSKQVIHPCREMCHDYLNTCGTILGEIRDCSYLPPWGGDIPCLYHLVRCTAPPIVTDSTVEWINDTAEYSCSEGFTLVGNKTVTCKSLGLWSAPPQCLLIEGKSKISPDTKSGSTLFVSVLTPLLSVYLLIILIIIILVICKIRSKAKQTHGINGDQMQADMELNEIDEPLRHLATNEAHLKRNREFDAFVLYHFDTDDDFVMNDLLPELEKTRYFKLFIHSRNFVPGRDIKDNIEEAIESSNSALIIMSQGFVDSIWCKEEFTHCYIENMKDAAFNLFVIMMQPADTLVNISNYMKTFFANKTYLEIKDPELFSKLAKHLENVKQLDNDDDENKEQMKEFKLVWQHDDSLETEKNIV